MEPRRTPAPPSRGRNPNLPRRVGWLLLAGLSFAGCSDRTPPAGASWRQVTLTDGSVMALPERPQRVVAASAATAEWVLALIPPERVVAVAATVVEGWSSLPHPDRWRGDQVLAAYRSEDVLAREPDLVVVDAYQKPETHRILRQHGIPVMALPEPRSFDDILDTLRVLGQALDAEETAQTLAHDLKSRHRSLQARGEPGVRVLSYTNWSTGSWTAGKDCAADLMIRLAGLANAGAESGHPGHWALDSETIMALDPDVILLGDGEQDHNPSLSLLRSDPHLSQLRAVRQGQIVVLSRAHWNATSYRILDAAEALRTAVEPLKPARPR